MRGIESFQVLYGLRKVGGGMEYLSAARIGKRWDEVVAVRIALLARGERNVRDGSAPMVHRLFGATYQDSNDAGAMVDEAKLTPAVRQRMRKLFQTTVWLRNPTPRAAPLTP